MCDIRKKTQLKTMTVYKAVYKTQDGKYLSSFAKAPVELGGVPTFKVSDILPGWYNASHPINGHISGCLQKKHAVIISSLDCFNHCRSCMRVIKIKLGGNILMGTTGHITKDDELTWNGITYAGSKILSIEELKL